MKILITDPVNQQCINILTGEGIEVVFPTGQSFEELGHAIREADALIVRSQTKVTAELLQAASKLKVIGRAGAGVDNIDVDAATRRGVIVMNTPGGNTISTAEHTISLMLALARNIPQANQSLKDGKWERSAFIGTELFGKTLVIIGMGKVGTEVARRCRGFEMTVIAYDPFLTRETAQKVGVEIVSLDDVFERADFISIHSPLTPETRGLIGASELSKCKRGVRIINCARGGIVEEMELLKALDQGLVAGAALDVFEKEPPGDSPLLRHRNVIATPHLGAATEEAQEKVAIQIAHQVADALKGRAIVGSVNADLIQLSLRKDIQPYLTLAEKMGRLIAQIMEGTIRSITASATGQLLTDSLNLLSAGVLKDMFESVLSEPVNFLNAPIIASERRITIQLQKEEEHDIYPNTFSVRYETDKESRTFSGTVFGKKDVRIVNIDGFHFDVRPEGNLLFYSNIDRPGMLASVSGILARSNINIGGLSLGRYGVGRKALTVVCIDHAISQSILNEIAAIEGVSGVKFTVL